MVQLSVVIITYNEEKNIGRCIDSVKEVADEIIVVDSFSEDRTEEICKNHGIRFIQQKWEGYSKTKNYANQLAQYDYIFSIDADEALSDELKENISSLKEQGFRGVYEFSRRTNYCGKWIRHGGWYPDKKIRLFDKNNTRWDGAYIHEMLVFDKDTDITFIKGDILHYSYYTIGEHINQLNKFTDIGATEAFSNSKRSGLIKILFSPILKFIKDFVFRLGFLDGYHGFLIAYISSSATFLKYVKLKQLWDKSQNAS